MLRRIALLVITFAVCISYCFCALAGERTYNIQELPAVTRSVWQETYQAYGRVIHVHVAIDLPDAEAAPVLQVRKMPPLSETQFDALRPLYTAPEGSGLFYDFRSSVGTTVAVRANPYGWNEAAGEVPGKVTQRIHALLDYDVRQAYADANSLTVQEAFDILSQRVQQLYPEEQLWLRELALYDRLHRADSGESIREKGYYRMTCTQMFHGLPILASVHSAYRYGRSNRDYALGQMGLVYGDVLDEEAYSLDCRLWQEQAVLAEDVPLVSFEDVLPQIEHMILSGNIRYVYRVGLGYVQYDGAETGQEDYLLAPAWVVWCAWLPEARDELTDAWLEGDSLFQENHVYLPIVINAVTGEVTDPFDTDEERFIFRWNR